MNKGFGTRWILRLLLTILLVFTMMGALGGSYVSYLLSSPHVFHQQVEKKLVPEKVHDSLSKYFQEQYNTTAIPPEVYLDVITEEWVAEAIENRIDAEYERLNEADIIYSAEEEKQTIPELETALTDFFAAYAEEIQYEPDEIYEQKLRDAVDHAETEVQTQLDVFHFNTMQNAGVLQKIAGNQLYLWAASIVCIALSIVLLIVLMRLERHGVWGMLYFPGCACFINGIFFTAACGWLIATQYFSALAIKIPAVYAAFTGVFYHCAYVGLYTGIVLLVLGLIAVAGSVINGKKADRQ